VGQFILLIHNRKLSTGATVVQFFSYFTILTNIAVALYSTISLLAPLSSAGHWIKKASVSTALAVYILIVGAVYNTILRFLWSPVGLQKLVDELLHTIIPSVFFIYWILFVWKTSLRWKHIPYWLAYPLVYLAYILVRGSITNIYPYPFLDVTILGYQKVLLNCVMLCIVFAIVSVLFFVMGRRLRTVTMDNGAKAVDIADQKQ
jgi:hypothetical protein